MAGIKDTFNPFNRTVVNIKEVKSLKNESLSSVLFINTKATSFKNVEEFSGAMSDTEISEKFGKDTALCKKIRAALTQVDTGGNSIAPQNFYKADVPIGADGDIETIAPQIEAAIKRVTLDFQRHFCILVFDDCTNLTELMLERLDTILTSWECFAWLLVKEETFVTEKILKLTRMGGIKAHKLGEDTYEEIADAAFAGRVIFMGVGKADGEAKTLKGVTEDKLSIAENDGGDLTVSEADDWTKNKHVNLYVQTVYAYEETSGMQLFNGDEFINKWELAKVKLDISMDLAQLRHEKERIGVTDYDEADVRATLVNRLDILKMDPKNPNKTTGMLRDYTCEVIELDRTLEDNVNKFMFNIQVSLRGIGKTFGINITAYKDGRSFDVEEA